jgi:hypothetical protein
MTTTAFTTTPGTVDRLYELLWQKGFWGTKHTRATVYAAADEWIATFPTSHQPVKQATPTPRKEIPMNANERVRSANEMAVLMADMATKAGQLPAPPRSENDGAVKAILAKMQEPLTTQLGGPIGPGHHLYVEPAPLIGNNDDRSAPVSHGFDPSIQNGMKGWSTLDAALYRKRMAAETEQNRRAELDRLRLR